MVAFCIIIGDTIPHVVQALFPSLSRTPFLWLFTDRRAIIVIFVLLISYPLSLYRDIAKVCESICYVRALTLTVLKLAKASTLALVSMLVIVVTVISQGTRIPASLRGNLRGSLFINSGIFQAIGVISFGKSVQFTPKSWELLLTTYSVRLS